MAMVSLREHMREHLADWNDDLSPEWRAVFDGVGPDFNIIPERIRIDDATSFFPRRRGQQLEGAPPGSHLCRAFDHLAPDDVRAVVLGQDPYPDRSRATGRAFEDGRWDGNFSRLSQSLRPLLTSAALSAQPGPQLNRIHWDSVAAEMARQSFDRPEEVRHYFDGLERQGVLLVNAAWTFTGIERRVLGMHLRLWRPVVTQLLRMLWEQDESRIFVCFGKPAKVAARRAGVAAGERRVDNGHPQARNAWYYATPNPLLRANTALATKNQPLITWWPPMENEVRA